MDAWMRLRYLLVSLRYRRRPVISRVEAEWDLVDLVIKHCPRPYRLMCFQAAKYLKLDLEYIASTGRHVPTAVALAFEDVMSGDYRLTRLVKYLQTGTPGEDANDYLKKWRKVMKEESLGGL